MGKDLRHVILFELQRMCSPGLSADAITPIMNEISCLYPGNGHHAQNNGVIIEPHEKSLVVSGQITGKGLIHPVTLASFYKTDNPESLTPLSESYLQTLSLTRPDGSIVTTRYSPHQVPNIYEKKLHPQEQAALEILREARRIRLISGQNGNYR